MAEATVVWDSAFVNRGAELTAMRPWLVRQAAAEVVKPPPRSDSLGFSPMGGKTSRRRAKPQQSMRAGLRDQQILDAATQVFAEKGYADTSIQDIADRVGMLRGSVYYYIDSKEDLLYRILRRLNIKALQFAEEVEKAGGTPSDRLRRLIRGHLVTSDLLTNHLFFREFRFLTGTSRAEIDKYRDRYRDYMSSLITEGQKAGEFSNEVDEKLSAVGILTMLNGVSLWFDASGDAALIDVAISLEMMIMDGLACSRAPRGPKS
jgi:AcrR family transcriptional regulator